MPRNEFYFSGTRICGASRLILESIKIRFDCIRPRILLRAQHSRALFRLLWIMRWSKRFSTSRLNKRAGTILHCLPKVWAHVCVEYISYVRAKLSTRTTEKVISVRWLWILSRVGIQTIYIGYWKRLVGWPSIRGADVFRSRNLETLIDTRL